MSKLEDLKHGSKVTGILQTSPVTILDVKWHGGDVLEVTYRDDAGQLGSELIFRDKEVDLEVIEAGNPWAFDSDGALFRLASEAYRIRMAYLFDPWMAVHLSLVEPLPHQITAVYEEMLPRQPLRFLLADDPGAGKTIMTGLFIKELILRGDLERCLIVAPGNLTEQWQDELYQKFGLEFELFTNDHFEASRTGNLFNEVPLGIARLDRLSRNEAIQELLLIADWDLIVFDEAHKLSASVFGGEVKYTKRYRLGQMLTQRTRHLLLLTATPHNGKEEDFQLFMALLDPDRFEGRYREGIHSVDAADLMRRMVKEHLYRFDGTPLFPERRAYTVNYHLSDLEAALYARVTDYVKEEFNRAEQLEKGRKGTIGFALMILQRRLASSPEAIYQSLRRRRERLKERLKEEKLLERGEKVRINFDENLPQFDEEDFENLEDAPEGELEQIESQFVDLATSAQTITDLEAEIRILKDLEVLADKVRRSGEDKKWGELSRLLQEQAEMFDSSGQRRKLVIFTEHKDTLNYLSDRIRSLLGKPEAVVVIHGGLLRDERRRIQNSFIQDKEVFVLVATDAAGEGINLQRAHLMVNYDLPWNPTRLEQRFGRIHRIGQTEVCHLWNLVAEETREGYVYSRLLRKIEEQRRALGDSVFDVLGELFRELSLRQLLVEAIRYGDTPEVKAKLHQAVDNLADQNKVRALIDEKALAKDAMDISRIQKIREDFERAQAKRLQPHFVLSFFVAAFKQLGGSIYEREPKRFELTRVPSAVRNRSRMIGRGSILPKYERITFHKEEINVQGKPVAEFVGPGHPLMDAVIDLILERHRGLLKRGAFLVDPNDQSDEVRALFYIEHSIQDGRPDLSGGRKVISRQMQFVEINSESEAHSAGYAPFLDYQPLESELVGMVRSAIEAEWLKTDIEDQAKSYAIQYLVPGHFSEISARREERVEQTEAAVKARLTTEINYWDRRAEDLKAHERAGKRNARLNSALARRRADELHNRLQQRLQLLNQERRLSPQPPVLIGGALVIPAGMIARLQSEEGTEESALFGENRKQVELAAMKAVMDHERSLGYKPVDISSQKLPWDIESYVGDGTLRFIEVKGRIHNATTVTISKNEILTGLNKPEEFILAVVKVDFENEEAQAQEMYYVSEPFTKEPDFGATSVNYDLSKLIHGAEKIR
jgi:SNF2 family DNA or RNA helicase